MTFTKVVPQFPNRKVFVQKWSVWVSWRMVRHVQRCLSVELSDQDVEIIRGCLQTALRQQAPDKPKRRPRTTNREDAERAAANRARVR